MLDSFSLKEINRAQSAAIERLRKTVCPLQELVVMQLSRACSINLIARFEFGLTASTDWLKDARLKVRDMVDVDNAAELEERCLDWERYCDDQLRRAEGIAQRAQ